MENQTVELNEDLVKVLQIMMDRPQNNRYNEYTFSRQSILDILAEADTKWAVVERVLKDPALVTKPDRGFYDCTNLITQVREKIEEVNEEEQRKKDEEMLQAIKASSAISDVIPDSDGEERSEYVPDINPIYIEWGNTKDVFTIVKSRMWFPTYVVGESGNGKTEMVVQACAQTGREMLRVQINSNTNEDDLIGGLRLRDGNTSFEDGPVITAMRRGAICLIDEIDRGTDRLMCLQGILEGKPVLIKKTGEVVKPAPGFNVIACANTKGRGSSNGMYAARILDEAFLERFSVTIEQDYPSASVENAIVRGKMLSLGCLDEEFLRLLVRWSELIRNAYNENSVSNLITTRRLIQAVDNFAMFGERSKAIRYTIARFEPDVQETFMTIFDSIDASVLMRSGDASSGKK